MKHPDEAKVPSPFSFRKLVAYGWPLVLLAVLLLFRQLTQRSGNSLGNQLYQTHCVNCHGKNGEGLKQLIPPLAQADYLEKYTDQIPCIILQGMHDTIWVNEVMYTDSMPANKQLTPTQVYNLMDFMYQSWGNDLPVPDIQTVRRQLDNCPE